MLADLVYLNLKKKHVAEEESCCAYLLYIEYRTLNAYNFICRIKMVPKFNTAYEEIWVFQMWVRYQRRDVTLR